MASAYGRPRVAFEVVPASLSGLLGGGCSGEGSTRTQSRPAARRCAAAAATDDSAPRGQVVNPLGGGSGGQARLVRVRPLRGSFE